MGASSLHPSDQKLQSFGLGKLDDVSAESVSKHLEKCPDCQRRVAEISSDSFLARLQGGEPEPAMSATERSQFGGSLIDRGRADAGPPPPSESLPPGLAEHPDYEVIRELGQGGMGTVYLAQNRLMGRLEVLKVVSSHLMNRRGVLERFSAEIRNAARLHHTNIVTAYSASRVGESIIFAMEYVDGLDLSRLVKAKGPLPVPNVCNYIQQAATGLQHAHELGMVHRDIKPSNLMLARQSNRAVIKVLDFGLAKVKSEGNVDGGLTHEGQMLGTPDYIAPEQISDARRADIRADIYSLGCTFYYLLTGKPPFAATSLYEILQAHHSMDAMPLNLARPEVPVELAALVAKMMAKEPERRFQTPAEVARELTPFFKKTVSITKGSRADSSGTSSMKAAEMGQTVDSPAIKAEPIAAPLTEPHRLDIAATWNSLAETLPSLPVGAEAPVVGSRQARRWLWPSVAAASFVLGLAIALLAMGEFRLKTSEGELVFTNLPPDAVVTVDGEVCIVEWPTGKGPAKVRVSAGNRKIKVVSNGIEIFSEQEVTIAAGEEKPIRVRLERVAQPGPRKELVPAANPKPLEELVPATNVSATTTAINQALEKVIRLSFAEETPLEDVLKYIKAATKQPDTAPIPIYVDPVGLSEAGRTMTSTIRNVDFVTVQLKNALPKMLVQLNLAFCVKDGVLIITSGPGIEREQNESQILAADTKPETNATLAVLEKQIEMSFENETPLEDVIVYVKQCTKKDENTPGFEVYFDPDGLSRADKTMTSTVRSLDVAGVPLKTTLRLLLRQLDLAFVVENGIVNISDLETIQRNLTKGAKRTNPEGVEGPQSASEKVPENSDGPKSDGAAEKEEFVALLNGEDLTDWKPNPENPVTWIVRDRAIHTTSNGRLYTKRGDYSDFHLRAELMAEADCLGSVFFRSAIRPNRESAYAVQINTLRDASQFPNTGSLVKHVHEGGMTTIEAAEASLIRPDQWFTLEVIARGRHFLVKIDGKLVVEADDPEDGFKRGHIALHRDMQSRGGELACRKLEVREQKGPAGDAQSQKEKGANYGQRRSVSLFDGKTLTGWKELFQNGSTWKVSDGVLEGRGGGDRNPAVLVTERTNFSNFRLHLKYWYEIDGGGNIEIRRSPVGNSFSGYAIHHGLWPTSARWQIPVGTVVKFVNKAYGAGPGVERVDARLAPAPPKSWNTLDILAVKNRITVSLNGEGIVEYTDSSGSFSRGQIALTAFPLSVVRLQEITIEELRE